MKKLLFAAVLALAAVACNKDKGEVPAPAPQMATISFEHRIVEGHSMVRSANDFIDIIEEDTPKSVTVWLENTDLNKTYTCNSDESICIPVGTYKIWAQSSNTPGAVDNTLMLRSPILKLAKETSVITTSSAKITLNLSYHCYAVFAMIDECSSCKAGNNSHAYTDFYKVGRYFVGYFKDSSVSVKLIPYSDSSEFAYTELTFVTSYTPGDVFAEFGKYYVVHPTKIDSTTSGFDVNMPTMEEGEI